MTQWHVLIPLAIGLLIAMIAALPFGISAAGVAFAHPLLLAAAVGVGVSSSVIPYVCDQLAMARLSRATFSLMLSLLPATATAIGILVLRQYPTLAEISGIALVIVGVALHRAAEKERDKMPPTICLCPLGVVTRNAKTTTDVNSHKRRFVGRPLFLALTYVT
jgi:threonine/homoserine efflux transporter RhtA